MSTILVWFLGHLSETLLTRTRVNEWHMIWNTSRKFQSHTTQCISTARPKFRRAPVSLIRNCADTLPLTEFYEVTRARKNAFANAVNWNVHFFHFPIGSAVIHPLYRLHLLRYRRCTESFNSRSRSRRSCRWRRIRESALGDIDQQNDRSACPRQEYFGQGSRSGD